MEPLAVFYALVEGERLLLSERGVPDHPSLLPMTLPCPRVQLYALLCLPVGTELLTPQLTFSSHVAISSLS